ncbi:helix-turn-helix transcriptional regulator [Castellaniella sp.]|uniref:helix-turn-helix domain-containing protein n=1 Tax=Castellaniella sp. TaxID=1955812 RepID=UPI002AFE35CF|nr:helix-turn-helix transcriptional regulator [Castellaniella sp.]
MMTPTILFVAASPAVVLSYGAQPKYEVRPGNQIFRVGHLVYDGTDLADPVLIEQGQQFVNAESLLDQFIADHGLEGAMHDARRWVADEFYSDGPPTLAALRLRAGLTQGKLAEITQQPQSSISRLESGSENPSIDRAKRFATALNVSLDDFYSALNESRKGKV